MKAIAFAFCVICMFVFASPSVFAKNPSEILVGEPETIRARLVGELELFRGNVGYVMAAQTFFGSDMGFAYEQAQSLLTPVQFKRLEWNAVYRGSATDFTEERKRLFPNLRMDTRFHEMAGFELYIDRYYGRSLDPIALASLDMARFFDNAAVALSPVQLTKLEWRRFQGTLREFRRDRGLLIVNDRLNPVYKGEDGYVRFSEMYGGDMGHAYRNAQALLTRLQLRHLEWPTAYQGTVEVYLKLRNALRESINGRPRYSGIDGYKEFSKTYFPILATADLDGDMHLAFLEASTILSPGEFRDLRWGSVYLGTTGDFEVERPRGIQRPQISDEVLQRSILITHAGGINKKYLGHDGYAQFAEDQNIDMSEAWRLAKDLLSPEEFERLSWGVIFPGSVRKRRSMRRFMMDTEGALRFEKWFGKRDGLTRIVTDYMELHGATRPFKQGTLARVRSQFRAAASPDEVARFGWDTVNSTPPKTCRAFKKP